ncbi:extracellular solute-binding protein [Paenibacillus koleovorans]|uniref:extracellular solute-binding protein n=1 Tax=Paenibacillus koleovorans TaxID=121608 RepID=UPI000FDAEA79|nr:extracellular solute-binding protein [Paenibacillus koleovorans]
MKREAKGVIALFLSVTTLLAGCSGNNGSEGTAQPSATPSSGATASATPKLAGELISEKLMTIQTYFVNNSSFIDYSEKNRALQNFEKRTNIHLDLKFGDPKVMLASGDYPEMFFNANLTNQDIIDYSSQGILLPLNDLIDKYAPNIKAAVKDYPHLLEDLTAPDGKIYGISMPNSSYYGHAPTMAYINTQWLTDAGLKMPKTTAEFESALRAFKARGNGVQPFTGYKDNPLQYFLMNPFILADDKNSFVYVDGNKKLQMAAIQPEWKAGLQWANKLYKEGLIDPGAFTQTADQFRLLFKAGNELKGGTYTAPHLQVPFTANDTELNKAFDALPPLVGPSGKGFTNWVDNERVSGAEWVITKKVKDPVAAIKYLDFWINPDNFLWNWIGDEGVRYVPAKAGDKNMYGDQAKILDMRYVPGFVDPNKGDKLDAGRLVQKPTTPWINFQRYNVVYPDDIYGPHKWTYDFYRLTIMAKKYEPFKSSANLEKNIAQLWTTADQSTQIQQSVLAITNYVNQNMIRFITGDLNIDSGWDTYVQGLKNLKLDSYLALLQQLYDKQVFKK